MDKVSAVLYIAKLQQLNNTLFTQWSKEKKEDDAEVFEWEEDRGGVRVTFCAEDQQIHQQIFTCAVSLCLTKNAKMQFSFSAVYCKANELFYVYSHIFFIYVSRS